MIAIILFLLITFTLGQTTENVTETELKLHVKKVMDTAHNLIYHKIPTVETIFSMDGSPELLRMESNLKTKIIQDLLNQIVDVWAEMNVRILRGFSVLKSLRDKAKELVQKIESMGSGHLLKKLEIRQKLSDRVKELLDTVKIFFCANENDPVFFFAETHLRNLSARLDNENVKRNLLKLVYYNRIFGIANLTDLQYSSTSKEEILELWALITAWGKWAVLELMVSIKDPLQDLNTEINQHISSFRIQVDDLLQEISNMLLEILSNTDNEDIGVFLSKYLNGIENTDDIAYSLCQI
ncbi:uncharacterized protein [Centruroides vittatus]|uniref:uncharacterized protein isoform X2 n=1 Tax=Centruroides vittatus TaxID=120091 RepID=UPI00350EA6B2